MGSSGCNSFSLYKNKLFSNLYVPQVCGFYFLVVVLKGLMDAVVLFSSSRLSHQEISGFPLFCSKISVHPE
jgi:membrane-bound acyltransferase YfiQ involved in biofilm formation